MLGKRNLLAVLAVACLMGGLAGCQQTPGPRAAPQTSAGSESSASAPVTQFYVFGWGDQPATIARPRGGTTRGAPVTLAAPDSLPLSAISAAANAFERDRAAILALAGDYRTSFHFMETLGLESGREPHRPYHSWATEHIRVLEDTGRFISLQHTLVMIFESEGDTPSEPMLVKHWRQDWTYEDTELHTFRGNRTWARERRAPASVAGAWSQAVFQVDDSPRYEAMGRWTHDGNRSVWIGESAWRPLPRRELSIRRDYDVLEGRHEIVITPTGWLHVQDNWKRVEGEVAAAPAYVGREYGLDRYERITAPSLAAADKYWAATGTYWAAVRAAWRDVRAEHDRFSLRAEVDGARLFEEHFGYAESLAGGAPVDPAAAQRHARETIARFLVPAE